VDGITACITYTYLGSFSFSLTLFGKLFTAFFRQWRDADTDNLTIVFGHDAETGVNDGLFNDAEHALIPWLDGNAACVRSGYGCHIVDRNHTSIRIHTDTVLQTDIGFSGADMSQCLVQIHDGHVHTFLRFV